MTDQKKSLAAKLLKVQEEVGVVLKDSNNPYFKSKYADINSFIATVKPVLTRNNVVLLQPLTDIDGQPAIRTILLDAETGESIEYATPITPTVEITTTQEKAGTTITTKSYDPQKQGSAITYYRRYALQSALFLQAEDDDGNAASGKVDEPKSKNTTYKGNSHINTEEQPF